MKKALKRILLVLFSLALALGIAEAAVRLLDVPPRPLAPLEIPTYQLSDNPVLVFEYRPDPKPAKNAFTWSQENFYFNKAGFRDHEFTEKKPDNVFRTILLGDSTTAGVGVPILSLTYPKVMEKLLNQKAQGDTRHEVYNMAVAGYHTLQEVEALREKGLKYQPDAVMVCFCMNDFSLHADAGLSRFLHTETRDSRLATRSPLSKLMQASRLGFILKHRLKLYKAEHQAFYEEYEKKYLRGKSPVEAGLTLLARLQREHGFAAYVVILPSFRAPFSAYKSAAVHEKVKRIAEKFPEIKLVDTLEDFAKINNNARAFSYDGCHMNEYGHKTMAQILVPVVRAAADPSTGK